jgi:error-prone DNA polymerase
LSRRLPWHESSLWPEDGHGTIKVVVWAYLDERQRRGLLYSHLMPVKGRVEFQSGVRHVIAGQLRNLTHRLNGFDVRSRDFK